MDGAVSLGCRLSSLAIIEGERGVLLCPSTFLCDLSFLARR
jgi:hypothetical protein